MIPRLILLILALLPATWSAHAEIDAERRQALIYLLRQDCGSCHGMTLKGGLGPPLTPQAVADKPLQLLVNSIMEGRPGTAMPPWKDLLSLEEADWIARQLQLGLEDVED